MDKRRTAFYNEGSAKLLFVPIRARSWSSSARRDMEKRDMDQPASKRVWVPLVVFGLVGAALVALFGVQMSGCRSDRLEDQISETVAKLRPDEPDADGVARPEFEGNPKYDGKREEMVRDQIEGRGVKDTRVLKAMRKVPRHEFVPPDVRHLSYEDSPLPIGEDQTISQPYMVAFMTEALKLRGGERVLEIGTGSGYQAAILAELCAEVYTIEIVKSLADRSAATLKRLSYQNVFVASGDGFKGWKEHAPFDAVIITCAPEEVPPPLIEQLAPGGRLVCPVGPQWRWQTLVRVTKQADGGVVREELLDCRFVPMTGEAERK